MRSRTAAVTLEIEATAGDSLDVGNRTPVNSERCWEDEIQRLGRVLLIVYLLETGLVLLVAPWSMFWERNWLVETSPLLGGVIRLAAVRGAVSGVGVVNLCAGLWELAVSLLALVRPVGASVPRPPEPDRGTASVETTGAGMRREDTSPWPDGP